MSEPVISVEGVGKRYLLGERLSYDRQLSRRINAAVGAPFRRLRGQAAETDEDPREEFWALRDVSLDVAQGEVVGLIGANGAGKSTLLKMLARITPPTEGRITLHGHVGSLLEVGTGFHPELTGRENIYLNGSILGMRRGEIDARYDEIVEFSGIERFIETPVKRYSSGMFIRLAFSVAAHLEPEILLVDEVLSVGDAEFQRKCLGKMDDAAAAGRTVVFVSHSLSSVQRLCHRAIWIDEGRVAASGPVTEAIGDYLGEIGPDQEYGTARLEDNVIRQGTGYARLRRVTVMDDEGRATDRIRLGRRLCFSLELELSRSIESLVTEIGVSSADGMRVVTAHNTDHGGTPLSLDSGSYEMMVELDTQLLPGEFALDFGIHEPGGLTHDYVERIVTFRVVNPPEGEPDRYPWPTIRGSVGARSDWSVVPAVIEADAATTPAP